MDTELHRRRRRSGLLGLASLAALAWAGAHHDGVIVSFFRGGVLHLPEQPIYLGHADTHRAALWSSATVIATEGTVLQRRF